MRYSIGIGRALGLLGIVLFALFATAARTFAQQHYTVTDLGTLGGTSSQAWGINNSGQIVGQSFTGSGGAANRHAFLYKAGVMQDLGTLGGTFSDALAINDAGQVVGQAAHNSFGNSNAFIFSNNLMVNLGALPSDLGAVAFSVNSSGVVVGLSQHNSSPNPDISYIPFYRGFVYRNGTMQDLSVLFGGAPSRASDINASGQVVGSFNFGPFDCGQSHAFLYSGPTVSDLGTLPGSACSRADSINDAGEIVGLTSAADGSSPRLFYYYGGVMQDLGTLGSKGIAPISINNAGQFVGSFGTYPFAAFLYSDGVRADLNTLIPANSGWVLNVASGINDAGAIVGWGYRNGDVNTTRAFLLAPTVPVLLTQPGSTRAIALNSVTHVTEPFSLSTALNFGSDQRTRIVLFARDLVLAPNEDKSVVTVEAEDAQHRLYSLPVEYVGNIPGFGWPPQIVVRLTNELSGGGDFQVRLSLRGVASNKATIAVKPD
jgi:probable HAF family extracellular repeat protein